MNLVIDDAVEVKQPTRTDSEEKRRELGLDLPCKGLLRVMLTRCAGQILLKGDNVSLIQALQ
jgi:small nuclear ribonucleoprotein E